ncbi:predicted membrane protein [Coriobacteriaceae bacterium EMTCatB1]|nr:predicted membrane protein [Coriobacteriaceae bacterium EMTCatB1]
MPFWKLAVLYVASLLVFLGIDFVWLTTMGDRFYRKQLGSLMSDTPNLAVALLFYLVYVVGVLVLVVMPAVDAGSLWKAVVAGALLGLVAYGTYDITNLSTIAGWPAVIAVVDLIWGTTLTAAVSAIGYVVARWLA